MDRLDCINTFICVVESGNFSSASRKLGMTRDQVAKRICHLEYTFSTSFFIRNTRKMSLTQAGEKFYQHCKVIISEYEWATNELMYEQKYPEGIIKINAPLSFSQTFLTQTISKFMDEYPSIKINLFLSDEFINIHEEKYDITLRVSQEIDPDNSRLFSTHKRYFYATPDYFNKYGTPTNIEQLKQHNILFYSQISQLTRIDFSLKNSIESIYITPKLTCNNGNFLLDFCTLGQGIIFLPDFLANEAVHKGQVIRCLEHYESAQLYFYAITPKNQKTPKKVQIFLDYIAATDIS